MEVVLKLLSWPLNSMLEEKKIVDLLQHATEVKFVLLRPLIM